MNEIKLVHPRVHECEEKMVQPSVSEGKLEQPCLSDRKLVHPRVSEEKLQGIARCE